MFLLCSGCFFVGFIFPGKILQLLCILPFDTLCLFDGLSESVLCVFVKLCPVCFLVVGESPSVLL